MVKAKLRLALAVVFVVLGVALLVRISLQSSKLSYDEYGFGTGQGLQLRKLNQPFAWHEDEDDEGGGGGDGGGRRQREEGGSGEGEGGEEGAKANSNKTAAATTCRNSVQGKILISDDRGYVCNRQDVLMTGCCNPNATSATRYACSDCHEASGCCKVYEHCISCCMDPKKKPILMKVLNEANALKNILLLSVSDHFELCLAKCRTSSRSVQHENVYINPVNKHCFVKGPQQQEQTAPQNPASSSSTSTKGAASSNKRKKQVVQQP